ncbi:MAG: hypothetical protein LYZ70_07450 [Nitrososphaerales archaeon]|nr:hypothetical protein [Nitrososphaerales archaeon]
MLAEPRFREPILREPLNEKFERIEKVRGTELTIAMGFYCENGVVLAADRRGTNGKRVSEVEKVFQISPTGLVAFSGNDYTWIKEFMWLVRENTKASDMETIKATIHAYEKNLDRRFGNRPPTIADFSGILATYGEYPALYQFGPWQGFDYGGESGRLVIGSASEAAEPFLRLAETFQRKMDFQPWRSLSTTLVERFAYVLVDSLSKYDATVHGAQVFCLGRTHDSCNRAHEQSFSAFPT